MAETVIYDPSSNQGMNNALPWMLAGQNHWGSGMGGWGAGIVGFLAGLLFGNGWGGFGGFGGGMNGGGAGFLSNQINNDAGRELLMNAINSNGEASRAAVQNLATMLGQDFNLVNSGVQTLQTALTNLAIQEAVSVPQLINSIQMGDSSLSRQLCECCCEMRQLTVEQGYQNQLRTVEQTNALGGAIAGASQRNVDAIADLKATMIQSFCDVKEREMQDKINTLTANNTLLRSQIDNANQTAAIAGLIAPIAKEVDDIKCKLPSTVSVNYPNLVAVNATPYVSGGFYQGGFNGYYGGGVPGFGFNNGITF